MALTPHKPNPLDKEAVEQYEKSLEDRKLNPHKWAISPSLDTQVIQHQQEQREKRNEVKTGSSEKPIKRTYKKRINEN